MRSPTAQPSRGHPAWRNGLAKRYRKPNLSRKMSLTRQRWAMRQIFETLALARFFRHFCPMTPAHASVVLHSIRDLSQYISRWQHDAPPSPTNVGEGRDGGVFAAGIAPIPVAPSLRFPPRRRGKEQFSEQLNKSYQLCNATLEFNNEITL